MPKAFQAIAAMSLNRVIGQNNKIPWHLPEDFKWFRERTLGHIVVMGRKTFESLGKPLPNRKNLILTRHPRQLIHEHSEIFREYKEWRGGQSLKLPYQLTFTKLAGNKTTEIRIFSSLDMLNPAEFAGTVFICGGAQVYQQTLPRCSDLYLTIVNRVVEGDCFFPEFEKDFRPVREVKHYADFKIMHYRHRTLT